MSDKCGLSLCKKCKMQENCKDIPGFCLLLPYAAIASIVLLLVYFISNSQL